MRYLSFVLLIILQISLRGQEYSKIGLIQHWTFDDQRTTKLTPEYGIGNFSGTLEDGTEVWQEGLSKSALVFTGQNYNTFKLNKGIDLYSHYTISFWVHFESTNPIQTLFCQYSEKGRFQKLFVHQGKFVFQFDDGKYNSSRVDIPLNSFDEDKWNFISLSLEGSVLKLYVNGELATMQSDVKINIRESQYQDSFILGNDNSYKTPLIGRLDELFIYERSLSNDEVKALYEFGISLSKKKVSDKLEEEKKSFKDRKLTVKDTLALPSLSNASFYVEIWDAEKVDGDEVELFLNGRSISKFILRSKREPERIELPLVKDSLNVLVLYALNTGSLGKNTAQLKLISEEKVLTTLKLSANDQESEAIEIRPFQSNE